MEKAINQTINGAHAEKLHKWDFCELFLGEQGRGHFWSTLKVFLTSNQKFNFEA